MLPLKMSSLSGFRFIINLFDSREFWFALRGTIYTLHISKFLLMPLLSNKSNKLSYRKSFCKVIDIILIGDYYVFVV
jgi:hypothetical protein